MKLEIDKVLAKIEKSKSIIAKERDKLRNIYSDLETVLDSFDRGVEGLENGKREIVNAIDSLSEFV